MGRKIFVSYKYRDNKVNPIWINSFRGEETIVRHYVDELQSILDKEDHINLGEKDGESLEDFSDSTIETSLKNKIFQSSITIVMLSKGMKDNTMKERDQWIPWEISYSLREVTRSDYTSRMNAVLGIVLPDEDNSYSWYYSYDGYCNCTTHYTAQLFDILKSNMFNIKEPEYRECNNQRIHTKEDASFIKTVEWSSFKNNPNYYLDKAIEIRAKKDQYNIKVNM